MAKYYIDRERINLFGFYDAGDYNVAMRCINSVHPADVIERSEYTKLHLVNLDLARTNEGLLEEHKQLTKLRSKIDDTIKEIIKYRDNEKNDFCEIEVGAINGVLEIIKKNIGKAENDN